MINVLSLFDGISCGQLACVRAGLPVRKYYASEIDPYAIKVTQSNFPNTIQLGSVSYLKGFMFPKIDLLIGGSPCQGFSFAGKQLNFSDPRSKLFFEFVRLYREIKKYNPKVKFLLENVVMKQEYQDVISGMLEVKPIRINSALVSAQNRKRLYWTNIEGVEQPEDKGLLLDSVLEGYFPARMVGRRLNSEGVRADYDKSISPKQRIELSLSGKTNCLTSVDKDNVLVSDKIFETLLPYVPKKAIGSAGECVHVGDAVIKGYDSIKRVYSVKGKSPALTAVKGGHQEVKIAMDEDYSRSVGIPVIKNLGIVSLKPDKSQCLDASYYKGADNHGQRTMLFHFGHGFTRTEIREFEKSPAVTTQFHNNYYHVRDIAELKILDSLIKGIDYNTLKNYGLLRKLTPVECERLQTLPDNYTAGISNSRRYHAIGNGWTVDVIAHILSYYE